MHVTAMEEFLEYAHKYGNKPPTADELANPNHTIRRMTSVLSQRALRRTFKGHGLPYDIHHVIKQRYSNALGISPDLWDSVPGIPLPRHQGVSGFDSAAYASKMGHAPVFHRSSAVHGGRGVVEELTSRAGNGRQQLDTAGKNDLIRLIREAYSEPPYSNANMWPITRDWLRVTLGNSVSVPN